MSVYSVPFLVEPGWGLVAEDLEKIIRLENLKDVTKDFSDQTNRLIENFGSLFSVKIIAFDENSGVDYYSKTLFKSLMGFERNVFYYQVVSNKECCVIFIHGSKGLQELKSNEHILAHECAHHLHFAFTDFPYYTSQKTYRDWVPPFVKGCGIGPISGSVCVDNLPLTNVPDAISHVFRDCAERVHDIICEGLLREKSLTKGFVEWYQEDMAQRIDPALKIPDYMRTPDFKRYVRRLALRDCAEWGATVKLAYPNRDLTQILSERKKFATKLNKKHIKATSIFDEIFRLCINTNFHAFKSPEKTSDYTKKILNLLNIKIKTQEKW